VVGGGRPLCLFLCHHDPSQREGQRDPCGIHVTSQVTLRGNLEIVYVVFLKVQIELGGKIGGRNHGLNGKEDSETCMRKKSLAE